MDTRVLSFLLQIITCDLMRTRINKACLGVYLRASDQRYKPFSKNHRKDLLDEYVQRAEKADGLSNVIPVSCLLLPRRALQSVTCSLHFYVNPKNEKSKN